MSESTHSSSSHSSPGQSGQSGQSGQPRQVARKYDAYEDLGLSRSLSSAELSQRIDTKISTVDPTNVAELDKLQTIRSILGSQHRRASYDAMLNDSAVHDLGVAQLRSIAAQPEEKDDPAAAAQSWTTQTVSSSPLSGQQRAFGQASPAFVSEGQGAQGTRSVNVSLDVSSFYVTDERPRSSSLMWTIGWGWIFLTWLYMLFVLMTTDFSSSAESSGGLFSMISGYEKQIDEVSKMLGTLGFVLLNTIGCLVFLQFVWNVRNYLGRRHQAIQ